MATEFVAWTFTYERHAWDTPLLRRAQAELLVPGVADLLTRAAGHGFSREQVLADLISRHIEVRSGLEGGA